MGATAKQRRDAEQRRAARASRPPPAPSKPPLGGRGAFAFLAAAGTVGGAALMLWPSPGWHFTWPMVLFAAAVGVAAVFMARTAGQLCAPGNPAAGARTAVLLALMVVVPVGFDLSSSDTANLPKLTTVACGALTIVATWVVEVARPSPGPPWRNGLHWPVLALAGWTAITTATSISRRLSILGVFIDGSEPEVPRRLAPAAVGDEAR